MKSLANFLFILFPFFILFGKEAKSQNFHDTIITKNNEVIICKIYEITDFNIKFLLIKGNYSFRNKISKNRVKKYTLYNYKRESIVVSGDTLRSINFSYNVINAIINENSLYMDFKLSKHHCLGLSFGQIYYNDVFKVNKLSSSQAENPGAVYNGLVGRFYYNYIFHSTNDHELYIGPRFIYKKISYNNVSFVDKDESGYFNHYTRNEKSKLYGLDLVFGDSYFLDLTENKSQLFINVFTGVGFRNKHREIETLTSEYSWLPLGKTTDNKENPIFILGFRIGIRFKFK